MAVMQGVAEMNHERAERDSQRIVLSLDVLELRQKRIQRKRREIEELIEMM